MVLLLLLGLTTKRPLILSLILFTLQQLPRRLRSQHNRCKKKIHGRG
jgi:hypothetical protein